MIEIRVSNDLNSNVYKDGLDIRKAVFVDEQHVPADLEIDDNESNCIYNTLYKDNQPAAVARYFPTKNNGIHIQRVAVLKDFRHQGLASELIEKIAVDAKIQGYQYIILGAQDQANGFYKSLGFKVVGDQYKEAGILHHDMRKEL
ncbi:GNAT family N-acetyltransferase [Companilactobacillus sp.]|jgi:predicted GNAT family N-acyltransferase|uniref:GNAT family N-acetyltransferase n=1 Tax=Companilactobacillus sp. TaxID=2767905 RepID=UPI0025BA480B|nr:GNAT family N-acetyltransferase [Companilactobacillus sp.]MCH4008904.1 GNAT family N-acetyltransferase [Companilactobacillus sp.]MCH4050917.1 GNAT family N-acetyltransferase [Companilactobacillus sp.]MCH4076847.1 GNAT family N-acetyltransferase [Companilactobacillus sp.]MCH4125422.1 GNAT family N-acetyltransferase [Companilactobacillus sp.]MCH4131964.1 GNAT family N-acetyltransferase [Companilactobacillus sp.]